MGHNGVHPKKLKNKNKKLQRNPTAELRRRNARKKGFTKPKKKLLRKKM